MKKLRLDLSALVVESFGIHEEPGERGTVHGQAQYTDPRVCETNEMGCYVQTLAASNCATCDQSCIGTCWGQYTCVGAFTCQGNSTCVVETCNDSCAWATDCRESCVGNGDCW
jgi:hypothetical protein